jgi:hypothetical protein
MRWNALLLAALVAAPAMAQPAATVYEAGSTLEAELLSPLSSDSSFANDRFAMRLEAAWDREGRLAGVPPGYTVQGSIAATTSSGDPAAVARLVLRFESALGPSGVAAPLNASLEAYVPQGDAWRITTVAGGTVIVDRLRFFPALRGVLVDRSRGVAVAGLAEGSPADLVAPAPGQEIRVPAGAVFTLRLRSRLRLR